ncbi:MAG: hypothetical protein KBG28_07085 [Kofleriaceae bacterium]|nr:hypothetical protein [Kofleriaceae bacterium]
MTTTRTPRSSPSLVSTSLLASALTLGVGCLSKPDRPLVQDGGGIDAAGPGPDANPCPGGGTPFAADLVLRRNQALGDLGGDGRDDVVLWGRGNSGSGRGVAVVVPGSQMDLSCAPIQLEFPADVEPLDVRIVNLNLAGPPDLVMFGRDTSPSPVAYRVIAYLDLDLSSPGTPVTTQIPLAFFPSQLGGVLTNPLPVVVTTWSSSTYAELVIGGLDAAYGRIPFELAEGTFGAIAARDLTEGAGGISNVQDLTGMSTGNPKLLVATTQSTVYRMRGSADGAILAAVSPGSVDLTQQDRRSVRWLREPVGADLNLGITAAGTVALDGFDLIIVPDAAGMAPSVVHASDPSLSGYTVRDYALGHVDADNQVDAILVVQSLTTVELRVYLDVPMSGTPLLTPLKTVVGQSPSIVAVGDFDGATTSPDTIRLFSTTPGMAAPACYHVLPDAAGSCLVTCGVTTCP